MRRGIAFGWGGLLLMCAVPAGAGEAECRTALATALKTHSAPALAAFDENCRPLAQEGVPLGLFAQGRLVLAGLAPGDAAEGVALVRRAAEAGLVEAQSRLGRMYLHGEDVARDPAEAFGWFQQAAESGEPVAQYELGQRYYLGEGTAQSSVEAYKWFGLAVETNREAGDLSRSKLAQRKQQNAREKLSWGQRREADGWIKKRLAPR